MDGTESNPSVRHAQTCNGWRFSHLTRLETVEPWVYVCNERGCTWRSARCDATGNPCAQHEKGWICCEGYCAPDARFGEPAPGQGQHALRADWPCSRPDDPQPVGCERVES